VIFINPGKDPLFDELVSGKDVVPEDVDVNLF
jgi:hypothetical protein